MIFFSQKTEIEIGCFQYYVLIMIIHQSEIQLNKLPKNEPTYMMENQSQQNQNN